jgi:hypothetical protein
MDETNEDAATLFGKAAELSARVAQLAAAGKLDEALDVEADAGEFRRRARAAAARADHASTVPGTARPPGPSTREVTIAALGEIGVPAAPRAVSNYAKARFGAEFDHRALASLRRDEAASWARTARAVYVVQALEGRRFLQMRGKVALSSWPLEQRILGPWSERADHLTATANLARQLAWLGKADADAAERLAGLLAGYAATIPGALVGHEAPDPARVEAAAEAELKVVGLEDRAWREDAAERARAQLDDVQQLWGADPPAVVRGAGA